MRDAGAVVVVVDRMGFDSVWTWDHLYPIFGSPEGPIFEGYMTLAGWSCVTERVTLGLLVGANTFRNPALVAKMVTILDHMSGGRAVLGIGRARYSTRSVRNDPPPLQRRLPILVGGAGERKTLATVARYADKWNVGGDLDMVRHKDAVLRRWCEQVGRDSNEIERTLLADSVVVCGSEAAAQRVVAEIRRTNRGWDGEPDLVGTPETIVERLAPYLGIGFHSMFFDFPPPYDRETLERLANEVRPELQRPLEALPSC